MALLKLDRSGSGTIGEHELHRGNVVEAEFCDDEMGETELRSKSFLVKDNGLSV